MRKRLKILPNVCLCGWAVLSLAMIGSYGVFNQSPASSTEARPAQQPDAETLPSAGNREDNEKRRFDS